MTIGLDRLQSADSLGFVEDYLRLLREKGGTDLFLSVGSPPMIKINGQLASFSKQSLTSGMTADIAITLMRDDQYACFTETHEANFALEFRDVGRFRINVFIQKSSVGMVFREIRDVVPTPDDLGLPKALTQLVMLKRGLILVVGGSGSGKSSTLAALVDQRNRTTRSHIVTLEDPIEFIHTPHGSVITQREVGADTLTWESGLKNALRQSPDMMVIGEVRDRAVMEYALNFAETGHLCMTTLHANNGSQAIERVVNLFPEERREQVWIDLSLNLRAVLCQRLIPACTPGVGDKTRVAAYEVLVNTPLVSKRLMKGDVHSLRELMERGSEHGMRTFDQSLFDLYEQGMIRYEDSLRFAESVNDLKLAIKLKSQRFKQQAEPTTTTTTPLSLI